MLILGYIVSKVKYRDMPNDILQTVPNVDACVYNVPKLIVGLSEAKNYAKENNLEFDILNHSYSNGDKWTFGKTEKREMYEIDISGFKKYVSQKISDEIEYRYVNLLTLKYSQVKRMLKFASDNSEKRYYFIDYDDMVYVLAKKNIVMGVSLRILEYIGIEKDKIIELIKKNPNNSIYFGSSKKIKDLKSLFNEKSYVVASLIGEYLT